MIIKKAKTVIYFLTIFALIFLLNFTGILKSGFSFEQQPLNYLENCGLLGKEQLTEIPKTVQFRVNKGSLKGFVLYFDQELSKIHGKVNVCIKDEYDNFVLNDSFVLPLGNDTNQLLVETGNKLIKNNIYNLSVDYKGNNKLSVLTTNSKLVVKDQLNGNLLLSFAFSENTISDTAKILLNIGLIALLFCIGTGTLLQINIRKSVIFVLTILLMAFNFSFNFLNPNNKNFEDFQKDSEGLVQGSIIAKQMKDWDAFKYNLTYYSNIYGQTFFYYTDEFYSDNEYWYKGYHSTESKILIPKSPYSQSNFIEGNYLQFVTEDGKTQVAKILGVEELELEILVVYDSEKPFNYWQQGDLSNLTVLDSNYNPLPRGYATGYLSSFGLQGMLFRKLSTLFSFEQLQLISSIMTAIVLVAISYLIGRKYNSVLSIVYYFTFLLSPWMVNMARNLYWVPFTLFVPMLIGIAASLYLSNKKYKLAIYLLTFISILIKSLCGYEFITVVMLSLIQFLIIDLFLLVINKQYKEAKELFKKIIIIGLIALFGFIIAIIIHCLYFSNSIQSSLIFLGDLIQKNLGGRDLNINEYLGTQYLSLTTSRINVFIQYFKFSSEIISGVPGNLFVILILCPLIAYCLSGEKSINKKDLIFYFVSFITCISWFVIAKSHSYIHQHIDYILWYFGFVQICLYLNLKILSKLISYINNRIK